jgi:acyl carrier protein
MTENPSPQVGISANLSQVTHSVAEVISGALDIPRAEIDLNVDLRNVEGVDSVKVLRIIARIEREYDVELTDEQVFSLKSGHDVVAAVAQALGISV